MQRIALDAMGGDGAPRVIIEGALSAVQEWPDRFALSLVGIPERIRETLPADSPDAIKIVPASEVVEGHESPVRAIRRKPDSSIVVGLGLTIFAHSMSSFLHRVIFGNQFPILFGAGGTNEIPILSGIPIIGEAFFNQHWLVYLTFLLVPLLYGLMYQTRFGLRVRAVGETPWAADASGVNVFRIRYYTILFGGFMASLGGAFMTLGDLAFFVPDMNMGRGYIAIVVVMLGKWNPIKVCWGGLLFGFALALTSGLQVAGINISPDFILMMPYIVVILALLLFTRSTDLPSSLCIPYKRGGEGK